MSLALHTYRNHMKTCSDVSCTHHTHIVKPEWWRIIELQKQALFKSVKTSKSFPSVLYQLNTDDLKLPQTDIGESQISLNSIHPNSDLSTDHWDAQPTDRLQMNTLPPPPRYTSPTLMLTLHLLIGLNNRRNNNGRVRCNQLDSWTVSVYLIVSLNVGSKSTVEFYLI